MCEVSSIGRNCNTSVAGLTRMYMIDINDVVSIPFPNDDWVIEDDIVLRSGAYFKTIAFREQQAGLADAMSDAIGGGFTKTLGLYISSYGHSNKWIYNMVGTRFIALIEDFNGQVILIGNLLQPMRMDKADGNTGQKMGDKNGWAVTIIAESGKPCYLYTGIIKVDTTTPPTPPAKVGAAFLKLKVNADGSGVADSTFNYYVPAGNIITCPELSGKKLVYAVVNATLYEDFSNTHLITQNNTQINFTNMGGLNINDWIIIAYQ